ncbi:MAG: phage late control D family protein [Polyangiales bacterium]
MPDDTLSGDVLPEVAYAVSITGVSSPAALSRWHCVEALHEPYECVVELAFELGHAPPIASLLEKSISLSLSRGALSRHFAGVITEVEDRGVTAGHHLVTVVARPELWLLSQRARNRVYQSVDSVAITRAVLTDAGLYAGARFDLTHAPTPPPTREYCVQLGETDLDHHPPPRRRRPTLAFDHKPEGETLLLLDGARASTFTKVATLDHAPVRVMGDGIHTASSECVGRLEASARSPPPAGSAVTGTSPTPAPCSTRSPRRRADDGALPRGLSPGRYSGDL